MIRKAEAVHKTKIQDWDPYDTAEEESCIVIIDSVDDVWIAELKKKMTKYAEVKAIEMISHLRKTALGTHEVDILEFQDQMREVHLKVDSIPEYKYQSHGEGAGTVRACTDNKILDAMMANIANKTMLSTERYPKTNDDWEDLPIQDVVLSLIWRTDQQDSPFSAG